jgi:TPR repeat protein
MRNLTATICLTLAVLLGVTGCQSNNQKGANYFHSGDYASALRVWKKSAEKGNAYGQYNLGLMYAKGDGVPQDYKTALKWFTLAAEQGYAGAQSDMGSLYRMGLGVPKNHKTAVKWYKLAAEQGYARAQSGLGQMYEHGMGVPQDYMIAVKWFTLAAEQGLVETQSHLRTLLKSPEYTNALKKQNAETTRGEGERLRETCSGFGFKDGSKEMSTCMFDLYKLEKSKSQPPTVIQNNSGDSSAVRALLEEQKKQRQLEGALELMKRGSEMLNPPKPRITCKYNSFTKTTVCN